MAAYYNEFDGKTAAWLRELMKRGLIADGEVDERSITEVQPDDVRGFTQAHFFAGIGGWSYALRLAGFPDDRHVWTGSPPCQPFSAAGQRKGAADARNLWPVYARLIAECRPATLFGEQVAAAIGNGWLDAVFADLESQGYATAATVLPAASVGAPHIRQRLWIVADNDSRRLMGSVNREERGARVESGQPEGCERSIGIVADSNGGQSSDGRVQRSGQHGCEPQDASAAGCRVGGSGQDIVADSGIRGRDSGELHSEEGSSASSWREHGRSADRFADGSEDGMDKPPSSGRERQRHQPTHGEPVQTSPWASIEWLPCADGKARPTKPGLFPLADGIPGRVGILRGAGNAITPQVAAEVIAAYMDITHEAAQ